MLTERELVQRAKAGDNAAFSQLVSAYEGKIYNLALRYLGNPEDAMDASQEVFLRMFRFLSGFQEDSSFSTWLYRLASNACVDLLRKEGRHQAAAGPSLNDEEVVLEIPDEAPTPHALAEQAELKEQIEAGLAALPEEYREVLILREIHQQSYDEIAEILSLDLGTVKSRINRGRKRPRVRQ